METHRWGRHPDMLGRVCDCDQLPRKSKAQTKPIPWVGISERSLKQRKQNVPRPGVGETWHVKEPREDRSFNMAEE